MSEAQQDETTPHGTIATEDVPRVPTTAALGWSEREVARLRREQPALAARLHRVWHRPAVVLVPLGVVVPGLLGAVIPGGDAAWFRRAGASMLGPDVWDVFSESGLQVGPLYLLAVGLLQAAAEALGLQILLTVAGVQCGLLTWLALGTTGRVLRAAGVTGRRATAAPWAVGLALTLGGLLAESVGNGHPEEVLLGLLLVEAALLAQAGRRVLPGLLVGVAGGVKLWGVLGAPLLLLGRRPGTIAARCAVAGVVVVACYLPFVLLGEVNTFEHRWGLSAGSTLGLASGWLQATGWTARVVQGAASGLAGSAVALRRFSPVAVVLVVVAVRLLLDPLRLTYYSGPLVVVGLLWAWSTLGTRTSTLLTVLTPVVVLSTYVLSMTAFAVISTVVLVAVPVAALGLERARRSPGAPA